MRPVNRWEGLLAGFQPDTASPLAVVVQKALYVARALQARAVELQTPPERRQQAELDRMLRSPRDKATLVQMTDQAFRSSVPHRAVDQFIHILDVQGIPRFFNPFQRTLLKGFQSFGGYAPGVAVPLVKERMRKETANVILPAEREWLARHLRARQAEGVRMNVNFLGEAILGEAETQRRLQLNLAGLESPEVECLSLKISTLDSQISPLAREATLSRLVKRLEVLYRTAGRLTFERDDGTRVPKFVYLDMEEYRDLSLTAEAFMRALDRPGLEQAHAGIALQSYIPDSFTWQQAINAWARRRVERGGTPITVRLVKGANLEMERVEASLRQWPQAPYRTKLETDANFKRMLHEALQPGTIGAVRLGIASHNLFDVAYALVLADEAGVSDNVQFEMLEGMANPQRRALFELSPRLLLYAPVCHRENFLHAIGYLIRRLDENTGPENFLCHAFRLRPGSPDWERLEQAFLDSLAARESLTAAPRRTQDRRVVPESPGPVDARHWWDFANEPDTDFALPHNAAWAGDLVARWAPRHGDQAARIPLVVDGREVFDGRPVRECLDPSRPGVVVGRYLEASDSDIEEAVGCAQRDADGWRRMPVGDRHAWLGRVAQEIRVARGDLMGAALADGGKVLAESDAEVSEAVDFLEFYRDSARWWQEMPSLRWRPKGVVVVVSPWNFPIAIPCGGIAAGLAAGNTVILKPASDAVLCAWELCQCFWRAGVSRKTLQLVPGSGSGAGRKLVAHPGVNAVILTGGTATARGMLRDQPALPLSAETGGKNAMIVTALADRDLAIRQVVHSAFSHSGQKCSAASLLLLEAEVYDDPKFKQALVDAVQSLAVGSAWDLETRVGPLIRPPAGDLETALRALEPGESWAVVPRCLEGNPNLWSPGVKYGVPPGSLTHLTEFFGPVLGVMRFHKLAEAIDLVHQTGYGLTSGLQSLDDREQAEWLAAVRAGNLYLNRTTVGAVVLRQPFGGFGKSAFGPGLKAGGPNYVAQFMDFEDHAVGFASERPTDLLLADWEESLHQRLQAGGDPVWLDDLRRLRRALESLAHHWREEFGRGHDHFRLVGQDNFRRYLPVRGLRIRLHAADTAFDLLTRVAAARTAGCRITVSHPDGYHSAALRFLEQLTESWAGAIEFVEESDDTLAGVVEAHETDRLRYAASDRVPLGIRRAAAEAGVHVADSPVVMEGRLELLRYVQEQSISFDYHRYGNLGSRADESRAVVR